MHFEGYSWLLKLFGFTFAIGLGTLVAMDEEARDREQAVVVADGSEASLRAALVTIGEAAEEEGWNGVAAYVDEPALRRGLTAAFSTQLRNAIGREMQRLPADGSERRMIEDKVNKARDRLANRENIVTMLSYFDETPQEFAQSVAINGPEDADQSDGDQGVLPTAYEIRLERTGRGRVVFETGGGHTVSDAIFALQDGRWKLVGLDAERVAIAAMRRAAASQPIGRLPQ